MKPAPKGWPRISASLFYDDASKAIHWLCEAFGFTVRLKVVGDDGRIEHSELEFGGDGLVMIGEAVSRKKQRDWQRSPKSAGGCTGALFGYVDDVEAHCAQARKAGAVITMEPTTSDYGDDYWSDRSYGAVDLEGHHWWFAQRLKTGGK